MGKENKKTDQYAPDFTVTPGEILEEYIESYGMSQAELADRTDLSKKTINEIIQAKTPITPETALKFELVFGRPAHFWNNLEWQYQEDKVCIAEKERQKKHVEWMKRFPLAEMAKRQWIQKLSDKTEQLAELLGFFGVVSPERWELVFQEHQLSTLYRQSGSVKDKKEAISAWLRQGEIEAQKIHGQRFDKTRFRQALDDIRQLTTEADPELFIPRLQELCAQAGVAVVLVPELPGMGISGATRFHGDKAIIQLSLRYKSNDHLWFTFFHEAGHIIKHGRKEVFLEGIAEDRIKEDEADQFAQDQLIPPKQWKSFLRSWDRRSLSVIERFAKDIGIAPGIIVGRLQHKEKLMNPKVGNKLKVFYSWSKRYGHG